MRESLTIFAIAIILVLSALLVGPYFVDWDKQRDWLAARLSQAVGAQVRIAGPVDVKLLPRPIFRAGRVSMAGATPQDPRISAERLDAELSLNGLLQGTVEFVEARLSSPRLEVTVRADGALVAPPLDVANPQKIQFKKLWIEDGTIALMDETGAETVALSGIAAEGEAESLFGPIRLSGSAEAPHGKLAFRLNTGAYAARKLRARLILDGTGDWTHAEAEGQVSFGLPTAGQAAFGFTGNANLLGSVHVADGAAPVPWNLVATGMTADSRSLTAPSLELRAGAEGRALVATGGALLAIGKAATGVVKLHARQLDLDRVAVPPEVAPDTPRPTAVQWREAVRRLLEGAALPVAGITVEMGVDAITAGDLTLTDAALTVDTRPAALPHVVASVAGPDGTRMSFDGSAEIGSAPAFKGLAEVMTRDLATVGGWADHFWPGIADWVARGAANRAVGLRGIVDVSAAGVTARDAALSIGGSAFAGTLSLTAGVGDERPRLFADLKADALDTDQWPDLQHLAALAEPLDLSIGVRSDSVRLGHADTGPSPTGRMSMHLTKTGPVLNLDRFEIAGLDGAVVTAAAAIDADRHLHAQGRVGAKDVGPLAALGRQLLPGAVADWIAGRAAALSPLDVGFTAEATVDDLGLAPKSLSGSGTAGMTRFSGSIAPELRGGTTGPVALTLTLDAPEAVRVLQQWGWRGEGALGALHADLQGRGSLDAGFDAKAAATLPNARLSFDGRVEQGAGRGRLTASGSDAASLLQTFGLAAAPSERSWNFATTVSWTRSAVAAHALTARLNGSSVTGDLDYTQAVTADPGAGSAVTGMLALDAATLGSLTALALGPPHAAESSGVWSTQPFGSMPAWPTAAVTLRIGTLDVWPGITARDAALKLDVRGSSVALTDMSAHLLGGAVGGALTLRRNGPGASLAGEVALNGLVLNLPNLSGRLSGSVDLAGSGPSPAGLVGSLAGDGRLTLSGTTMPKLDPAALGRVAADFNAEDAAIEDGPVRDALAKALDRGPLKLGDLQAPATVAAGTVRIVGLKTTLQDSAVSLDAALDLGSLTQNLRVTLMATALPKDWKGDPPQLTVTWKGPMNAPTRDLDPGVFINGLAARAIAREQERIELMKDDLRERAFFARRLRQIEAEQQAVRDAARIQKMVPQPPRPGDIRLPKPPDVNAPAIPGAAQPEGAFGPQDELKKLIEALQPKPPVRPNAPAKPIDLAPPPRTVPLPPASATVQDPASEGRY